MGFRSALFGAIVAAGAAWPVLAAETIAYSYDVHGRVIEAARTGTVNDGVETAYTYDDADNRTQRTTVDLIAAAEPGDDALASATGAAPTATAVSSPPASGAGGAASMGAPQ